jgi:hypothetical protein
MADQESLHVLGGEGHLPVGVGNRLVLELFFSEAGEGKRAIGIPSITQTTAIRRNTIVLVTSL